MGAGSHNEPLTSPGNFFLGRKRRVAKLFAELLGRSFLPLSHFAAFDHHIMRVALSLNLDLTKFDQSCLHISMFRWFEFQDKCSAELSITIGSREVRVYSEAVTVCPDFWLHNIQYTVRFQLPSSSRGL